MILLVVAGVGRCDARCYRSRGGSCGCVCGGLNHGVGLDRARENARGLAGELALAGVVVNRQLELLGPPTAGARRRRRRER